MKPFSFPIVAVPPPCNTAIAADQQTPGTATPEAQEWHQPAWPGTGATPYAPAAVGARGSY